MKLVRDRTEKALSNPQVVFTSHRRASAKRRRDLLVSKLLEEVGEWNAADSESQRLKELADMLEVLWACAENDNINWLHIASQAYAKRSARGGFGDVTVMKIETDEDRLRKVVHEPVEEEPRVPASAPLHQDMYVGDGPYYSG